MDPQSVIHIKNLKKSFGDVAALKGLSLSIQEGEIYGIIGRSGAGKSTLIHCLTALEPFTEGEIWVAGQELSCLTHRELREARRQMGMVFQQFNLFSSRTALGNVCYPLEIAHDGKSSYAYTLLEWVGLKGKEHLYPAQLSGGEKQRVAIARALVTHPKVLLCDEPTSALDPENTRALLALLQQLNHKLGVTIVIITHEMEVIKQICTHMAVLEGGLIVEEGRPTELFASPQHPITKSFLQHVIHEIPSHLIPDGKEKELLRLCFTAGRAEKPIISQIIRKFNVEINILLGGIDTLQGGSVGSLVVEVAAPLEVRQQVHHFLSQAGVIFEVIAS